MGQTGNAGKTIVYVILPKWVEAYRHGVWHALGPLTLTRAIGMIANCRTSAAEYQIFNANFN